MRCVRGGTRPESFDDRSHYDIDPKTVLDLYTGLRWQRNLPPCDDASTCPPQNALPSSDDALAYCEALELDSYDDFRLPSLAEVYSIVYPLAQLPSLSDPELFPEEAKDAEVELWSSTRYALSPQEGAPWLWTVDHVGNATRDAGAVRARCVRTEP